MSGSNDDPHRPSEDDDDDAAAPDTWAAGLRRRRRSRGRGGGNDDRDSPSRPREQGQGRQDDAAARGAIAGSGDGRNFAGGSRDGFAAAAAVPCGGGGGAVVMSTGPSALGMGGGGALPPSTPLKPSSKETDLVAATPSSVTTAGMTAESTLAPPSPRRRRSRQQQRASSSNSAPSLHRQYRLLRSQILLLLGTALSGLVLFLFTALPLAAFVSLALMVASMGALLPVARSALQARYEMELARPGGLTRYLPEGLRVMLTETSLHEFMTDTTFMMEHRYLLLYFVPGLRPEQLMGFIDQLPPRHRDALLQPGLGRMVPSVMENLMRIEGEGRGEFHADAAGGGVPQLENGDGSVASGLTEHHMENEDHEEGGGEDDATVTLLEAVTGLRRTLADFALDGGDADELNDVIPELPLAVPAGLPAQTPLAPVANDAVIEDDDNSSFDFSITLSVGGLPDTGADHAAEEPRETELHNVIVELPQSENQHQDEEARQLEEQDLEGRILSEAASAAAANLASQAAAVATDTARETATEAVVSTSSWTIRAGSFTGLLSGGGGIVAAVLANPGRSIVLGIFGARTGNSSSNGGAGGASDRDRSGGYQSLAHGLFATSAFGFVSAGVAYLARNQARASIAANRARRLKAEEEDAGKGEANGPGTRPE